MLIYHTTNRKLPTHKLSTLVDRPATATAVGRSRILISHPTVLDPLVDSYLLRATAYNVGPISVLTEKNSKHNQRAGVDRLMKLRHYSRPDAVHDTKTLVT